jgi:hypothetical protein
MKEYKYNEQNKLSEIVEKEKDIENIERHWVINRKTNFKYNDTGNLVEATVNSYDKTGITIVYSVKYYYSYNENGELYNLIASDFENQEWKPLINCSFLYNNQRKLIKADLFEAWYGLYETPLPSVHNYKYSENGYIQEYSVTGAYDIFIKYNWNSSGNLVNESWNDYGWHQNDIIKYEYNSVGDLTKRLSSLYYENQTEEYFYNDVDASEITNYSFFTLDVGSLINPIVISPKKQISSIKSWKENGGEWSFSENSVFFYSPINLKGEIFTSLKDINQSEICVYPNPATDKITFTWNKNSDRLNLKLFQVTGSCVFDRDISLNETITLEKLPKGIYFYQLIEKQHVLKAGKLIIQ